MDPRRVSTPTLVVKIIFAYGSQDAREIEICSLVRDKSYLFVVWAAAKPVSWYRGVIGRQKTGPRRPQGYRYTAKTRSRMPHCTPHLRDGSGTIDRHVSSPDTSYTRFEYMDEKLLG